MKDLEKKTSEEQLRVLGVFSLQEQKAEGRPYCCLQSPERRM